MKVSEILLEANLFTVEPSSITTPDGKPAAYYIVDDEGNRVRTFRGDKAETAAKDYAKKYNKSTTTKPATSSKPSTAPTSKPAAPSQPTKPKGEPFQLNGKTGKDWEWFDKDGNSQKGSFKEYKKQFKAGNQVKYQKWIDEADEFAKSLRKKAKGRTTLVAIAVAVPVLSKAIIDWIQEIKQKELALLANPTLSQASKKKFMAEDLKESHMELIGVLRSIGIGFIFNGLIKGLTMLGYAKYARMAALRGLAVGTINWPVLFASAATLGATWAFEKWLEENKKELFLSIYKEWAIDTSMLLGYNPKQTLPPEVMSAKDLSNEDTESIKKEIQRKVEKEQPKNQSETPPVVDKKAERKAARKDRLKQFRRQKQRERKSSQ